MSLIASIYCRIEFNYMKENSFWDKSSAWILEMRNNLLDNLIYAVSLFGGIRATKMCIFNKK